jgi:hypothetical protein
MKKAIFFSVLPLLAMLIAGCEYDHPKAVWDPNEDLGVSVTVTSVEPAGRADAGVQTIRITGQNFSAEPEKNQVYFGGIRTTVRTSSPTELIVNRPNTYGDSLLINVRVEKAYILGRYSPYGVAQVARLYGNMPSKNIVQMIDLDAQESIYALKNDKTVIKIPSNESPEVFGSRDFRGNASDLKVGPGGQVFIKQFNHTNLYAIPAEGGVTVKYGSFAKQGSYIDFDENNNCYTVGKNNGVSVLKPDLTSAAVGDYEDLDATWIRACNGFIYVSDAAGIYRSQILGPDGSLGTKSKVFDLTQVPGYDASAILSFAVAQGGNLYVATDNIKPLLTVSPDGTVQPFYSEIIIPNSGQLVWGNGNFAYVNMTEDNPTNDIFRIDMAEQGAPYQGRMR